MDLKEFLCGDCLCRVCARNITTDNTNRAVPYPDCEGCNACDGAVVDSDDCPRSAFVPDDDLEVAMEWK